MKENHTISQEMLDRYVSGNATLEEMALISMALKEDENLRNVIGILESLKQAGALDEDSGVIPMASAAAVSEGNLCDVMCERFILNNYSEKAPREQEFLSEALDNRWLKESGTPLHNVGRLLEKYGMTVTRKYGCTLEELAGNIKNNVKVIAVVDYGQLWDRESNGVFHAVVVLTVSDGVVRIYDPAIDGFGNYLSDEFARAWQYSKNYMVCASADNLEYIPHPIDVSDVELDEELTELTEAIAENAHEIWASKRRAEGWRYGPQRDEKKLLHPDMVPYGELPEGEKYYDRDMALNTIRLVRKLGFNITRRYTLYCPACGEYVAASMNYCPCCGTRLDKK